MSENWSSEGQPIPADARIKNRGRYGKYWDKTANVRARRKAYGWFIVLALLIMAVGLVDLLVLDLDPAVSDMVKLGVLGAFIILVIIGVMMLITRTNEFAREEEAEKTSLEAAVLQCPECKHIFEFKESHFHGAKKVAFTCPSCGMYGAMPDMSQRPVKKVLPEGEVREYGYHCTNCNEDIRIGIFGDDDARQTRFRACPHCGQKDTIELVSRPPPPQPKDDDEPKRKK